MSDGGQTASEGLAVANGGVEAFIDRWHMSAASERANYQLFLSELCDVLNVQRPDPAGPDHSKNAYVFERGVVFHHADGSQTTGSIDLYKRECFVLEAKQGSDQKSAESLPLFGGLGEKSHRTKRGTAVRGTKGWDDAMIRARGQAEAYAKALPVEDGWPPFLIVVDVGHVFELFADFSRTGKHYTQFPDASSFRVPLNELRRPEVRDRLRAIWTEPLSLDPARRAARVTREIAARLAVLAKSLESMGHAPHSVATFLMRCLFTMFAEDVGLLPRKSFSDMLEGLRGHAGKFRPMSHALWEVMNAGGFSPILKEDLLRFNGGLFEDADALPLTEVQLALLIEAAKADWQDVEPAIFGTLLERALESRERHKLGAHYTPRTYVERLVMPTIIEPLREEWENVTAAAVALANGGHADKAIAEVMAYHRRLCAIRVLDPACGSGNFLYVTLEHMKRLEGEVLDLMRELGETQYTEYVREMDRHAVDPHQFLGIEINPRAAAIADLVLWIGYLQWHFRTRGRTMPEQPVLKKFHNIECRDAVLAYDGTEIVRDEHGKPVTRWDGRTYKKHPVTGKDVPDETARVEIERYINPRPATWPDAHFIVGNPPYSGVRIIKSFMGEEYVNTLRAVYPHVPETCDYVMYWWDKAAQLVKTTRSRRFGFITTNSITQQYSRKLLSKHMSSPKHKIALAFAIADHPWVDESDGAAVRVSMTVGVEAEAFKGPALLAHVRSSPDPDGDVISKHTVALIGPNLRAGSEYQNASLEANKRMCFQGVVPAGNGFKLSQLDLLMLNIQPSSLPPVIRRYITGKDLTQRSKLRFIIDFFGLSCIEARDRFPDLYQYVYDRVHPERKHNRREQYKEQWWLFAETRPAMRKAMAGLQRFITTTNTSKHRTFMFCSKSWLPDTTVYMIASDDAFMLSILSSKVHVKWSTKEGGTLEDRPRYTSVDTFLPFPFPICSESQKQRIRELGEQLDRHRKERQALHTDLTITRMYNVLEKLKSGVALTEKERAIHEKGLVSVLKQIHEDLDREVFAAYDWPADLSDEEILERLVALNHERAEEERRGLIRWLRPEFQAPVEAKATQAEMEIAEPEAAVAKAGKRAWPKALPEQVQAVRSALALRAGAVAPTELARDFSRARTDQVQQLLETLTALGHVRQTSNGEFLAI